MSQPWSLGVYELSGDLRFASETRLEQLGFQVNAIGTVNIPLSGISYYSRLDRNGREAYMTVTGDDAHEMSETNFSAIPGTSGQDQAGIVELDFVPNEPFSAVSFEWDASHPSPPLQGLRFRVHARYWSWRVIEGRDHSEAVQEVLRQVGEEGEQSAQDELRGLQSSHRSHEPERSHGIHHLHQLRQAHEVVDLRAVHRRRGRGLLGMVEHMVKSVRRQLESEEYEDSDSDPSDTDTDFSSTGASQNGTESEESAQ